MGELIKQNEAEMRQRMKKRANEIDREIKVIRKRLEGIVATRRFITREMILMRINEEENTNFKLSNRRKIIRRLEKWNSSISDKVDISSSEQPKATDTTTRKLLVKGDELS